MDAFLTTSEIKLTRTNAGVLRIGDTRVSLDSVIIAFNHGAKSEQIVQDYDTLDLSQVYGAISYYLQHCDEVDSYLTERGHRREELRAQYNPQGIREKLLARRHIAAGI